MSAPSTGRGLLPPAREIEIFSERQLFLRNGSLRLGYASPVLKASGQVLGLALENEFGMSAQMAPGSEGEIILELGDLPHQKSEAYEISIDPACVRIRGVDQRGVCRGAQAFLQLLAFHAQESPGEHAIRLPACKIRDFPAYPWRGMHLDVARHFFPIDKIKRMIDLLAIHRMNILHWHLTDDQGWRLESRAFPRLTEIGARRAETPRRGDRESGDGEPYAEYYTQAEVREVVGYAADRGIDVLPEIDIPGHSAALLAAYPEFGNDDIPGYEPRVETRWGVHPWLLAPKPETFAFIEKLFREVAELFPFPFVHLGGDEVLPNQWEASPSAQAFIREKGLGNEKGLFGYFIQFAADVLKKQGRSVIGWDEIMDSVPAGAIVTVWRNWDAARKALDAGHEIIMAPVTHTYFDYYQADPEGEPEAIGGYLPLEKVAGFDPMPPGTPPEMRHLVKGAQGQLWTEYLREWDEVEYMALPRMCALAQVTWSGGPVGDPETFFSGLTHHLDRLGKLGYRFRPIVRDSE